LNIGLEIGIKDENNEESETKIKRVMMKIKIKTLNIGLRIGINNENNEERNKESDEKDNEDKDDSLH
jgi:hypothetical protein